MKLEIIRGIAFKKRKSFKTKAKIEIPIYKSGYRYSFAPFFKVSANQIVLRIKITIATLVISKYLKDKNTKGAYSNEISRFIFYRTIAPLIFKTSPLT